MDAVRLAEEEVRALVKFQSLSLRKGGAVCSISLLYRSCYLILACVLLQLVENVAESEEIADVTVEEVLEAEVVAGAVVRNSIGISLGRVKGAYN